MKNVLNALFIKTTFAFGTARCNTEVKTDIPKLATKSLFQIVFDGYDPSPSG